MREVPAARINAYLERYYPNGDGIKTKLDMDAEAFCEEDLDEGCHG